MDKVNIEELMKAVAGSLDLSKFNGDVVMYKHVEKEMNIAEGGIGEQHIHYPDGTVNEGEAPATPATPSPKKPKSRRKVLFIKDGSEFIENAQVKKREAQRLQDYLKAHKMSSLKLSAEKTNHLNHVIAAFIRHWSSSHLVADKVCGTALFRFLTHDVGLQTTVKDRGYGGAVDRFILNMDIDPIISANVADAFNPKK